MGRGPEARPGHKGERRLGAFNIGNGELNGELNGFSGGRGRGMRLPIDHPSGCYLYWLYWLKMISDRWQ